ncbi:MAG: hypothetical protein ACRD1U_00205 [Vicinamibacterales bacterium]
MTYRSIYTYAWDLADEGVSAAIDGIEALGLDTVTVAASYHAGKFLRPHGRSGKVYFPEDGTVYFNPDPARYGTLKPALNTLVREHDVVRELTSDGRVAVHAWMVLLHNSRLGAHHPEAAVQNAFGDRYVYSLCPSAPEARAYAVALCTDITENYPVDGICLETPGFLPYNHGYHHEFAMLPPDPWLERQLGLCFCAHCVREAETAGIDAMRVRARVRDDIEGCLTGDTQVPPDMADAFWLADVAAGGELSKFLRWRCDVVTSLVGAIRSAVRPDATVSVIPSVARPTAGAWYEGSDLEALAAAAGIIEACFYESTPDRVRADAMDVRRRLGAAANLRGILRPGYPDLRTPADLAAAVAALRGAQVSDIAFYNYGHLCRRNLAWIPEALAVLKG